MLHKNFSDLDRDYIILNSKYIVDSNKQIYFDKIEKLASLGQLNAIQDFYKLRDEVKGEGYVNDKVEQQVGHFIDDDEIDFEYAYALILRNKNYDDKNYVFNVVNENFYNQFFNDRLISCIIAERALDIYKELNGCDDKEVQTDIKNIRGVLKEGLVNFQQKDLMGTVCKSDTYDVMSYITTCYSLNFIKNKSQKQIQQCYRNLIRLSNKQLSHNYEDENC